MEHRYKLSAGTQVREEDFGLLFYTIKGPRLYFLPSGRLLDCAFFSGDMPLDEWLENSGSGLKASAGRVQSLHKALTDLRDKGVIVEF